MTRFFLQYIQIEPSRALSLTDGQCRHATDTPHTYSYSFAHYHNNDESRALYPGRIRNAETNNTLRYFKSWSKSADEMLDRCLISRCVQTLRAALYTD